MIFCITSFRGKTKLLDESAVVSLGCKVTMVQVSAWVMGWGVPPKTEPMGLTSRQDMLHCSRIMIWKSGKCMLLCWCFVCQCWEFVQDLQCTMSLLSYALQLDIALCDRKFAVWCYEERMSCYLQNLVGKTLIISFHIILTLWIFVSIIS